MRDLLVVGGGPTGLATSIMAVQAGLDVAVVEQRKGIIDKACGEGLMPAAVRKLGELGVEPAQSHPFKGIRYIDGSRSAEGVFPQGPGLGVRRLALHEALSNRAEELGVVRISGRVGELHQDSEWVEAGGARARYLVAADGLYSPIRKNLGLGRPPTRPPRLGLRRHYRQRPWSNFVEVYWSRNAEAYVTPVGEELVGVAILYYRGKAPERNTQSRYDTLLELFPALLERLGEPCTTLKGSGPFERRTSSRVSGRILLAGDAAGYLDPITGEGIRLGLDAGEAAVASIAAGKPELYDKEWKKLSRRYWWMTDGLLRIRRFPPTRDLMVPFLRACPWAFDRIVGALAA
jgi:flavin-dependent dehydrogenase